MFRQGGLRGLVAAAAMIVLADPAVADGTFESGMAGWSPPATNAIGSSFSVGTYGSTAVNVFDNFIYNAAELVSSQTLTAPGASFGTSFGLLTLGSSDWITDPFGGGGSIPEGCQIANIGGNQCNVTVTLSLTSAAIGLEELRLRLLSSDVFDIFGTTYNDSVIVRFLDGSSAAVAPEVEISIVGVGPTGNQPITTGNLVGGAYFDSDWQTVAVPTGTQFVEVVLSNSLATDGSGSPDQYNLPVLAIDYSGAATPAVPEPETYLLLAVGTLIWGAQRYRARRPPLPAH